MKWSQLIKWVSLLCSLPLGFQVYWQLFVSHQHCLPITLNALQAYADTHDGHFPTSPDGFGDALLQLIKDGLLCDVKLLTGPGDSGEIYKTALTKSFDVDETRCSRVYIQGLRNDFSGGVAIIFDRFPSRGGDHRRSFWGRPVREVGLIGQGMLTVDEEQWPTFVRQQVGLLQTCGIDPQEALRIYGMAGWFPK